MTWFLEVKQFGFYSIDLKEMKNYETLRFTTSSRITYNGFSWAICVANWIKEKPHRHLRSQRNIPFDIDNINKFPILYAPKIKLWEKFGNLNSIFECQHLAGNFEKIDHKTAVPHIQLSVSSIKSATLFYSKHYSTDQIISTLTNKYWNIQIQNPIIVEIGNWHSTIFTERAQNTKHSHANYCRLSVMEMVWSVE